MTGVAGSANLAAGDEFLKKHEVLNLIDDILDEPPGTIKGEEVLKDLPSWDSLAVVSFIAAINQHLGFVLSAEKLQRATTVPDLLALLDGRIEA